ncbi:uncharacterized protein F5Z01DRAFT_663129 [Emericellopsis atlantica]|uniref:Uncharacterized protein n=1 Tax=Emericellopsis atlantica TaxID=2614577 RepID=A0A9P7ZG94_9HYPO|nr:uncharacterized protein F5Z01DRAFT_663129 [Emericellopsis atlantica]KAG9251584.1 hypothetical protein F5Z01DRAFT_663129 [Emericellopsis atlantica]
MMRTRSATPADHSRSRIGADPDLTFRRWPGNIYELCLTLSFLHLLVHDQTNYLGPQIDDAPDAPAPDGCRARKVVPARRLQAPVTLQNLPSRPHHAQLSQPCLHLAQGALPDSVIASSLVACAAMPLGIYCPNGRHDRGSQAEVSGCFTRPRPGQQSPRACETRAPFLPVHKTLQPLQQNKKIRNHLIISGFLQGQGILAAAPMSRSVASDQSRTPHSPPDRATCPVQIWQLTRSPPRAKDQERVAADWNWQVALDVDGLLWHSAAARP